MKTADSWPVWHRDDGSIVSCTEKIKVMKDNLDELKQIAQDALEDGLLMEISEAQLRETLHALVDNLVNPYRKP
jgi:regulator of replication initiation timing